MLYIIQLTFFLFIYPIFFSTKSSLQSMSSLPPPLPVETELPDDDDLEEPSSNLSDAKINSTHPQPIRPSSALSLPSCSSAPDIDLTRPPSSLSESYVETGPLSVTPGKPSSKQPTPTQNNHQFSTPAKPKRRRMNSDENSLSGFEAFLSKELAAASKEREALVAAAAAAAAAAAQQKEKQDECDRLGIEMAEGVRYFTDPFQRAVVMQELRSVIFNRRFNPPVNPRQNASQQQKTTSQPDKSNEQPAAPTVHRNILQPLPAATNVPTQFDTDSMSSYGTGDLFRRSMNLIS